MRALLPLILLLTALFTTAAEARARRFGLGVVVAGPTGLTAEYFYAKQRGVVASLGWGKDSFHLNLDHLWNNKDWVQVKETPINVYIGVGLRWLSYKGPVDQEMDIGVRVPVGIQHIFKPIGIQVFFELAPAIIVFYDTSFAIDVALGARYFF